MQSVESISRYTLHKHQLKMLTNPCIWPSRAYNNNQRSRRTRTATVLANLVPTNYMVFDMFACILHKMNNVRVRRTASTSLSSSDGGRTRRMIHDVSVIRSKDHCVCVSVCECAALLVERTTNVSPWKAEAN